MALDPTIQAEFDKAHARAISSAAMFADHHAAIITAGAQHDSRLMNGFLANQLFNQDLVQGKSAFHTPVEPSAAPLTATPSK
jgi:hypothetical protein